MSQRFKTVYFSDYPAESARQRNLTLAFGEKDSDIYELVQGMSSHDLRELMAHRSFVSLQQAAEDEELPINTYCLRLLRQKYRTMRESSVQYQLPGFAAEDIVFEPIQTTFRGGQAEPLHRWYPFLEGYSPRFVEEILRQLAPDAVRVLDPFSGTGTTPLTVANLGREGFYCELNPLLQYLTDVKLTALTLTDLGRRQMASRLRQQADEFETHLAEVERDAALEQAYEHTFHDSIFFEDLTYDQVLRARSFTDRLACTEPQTAKFLTVAVLASLLPTSRLIRRGDVRYKTEQENRKHRAEFVPTVRGQLTMLAGDLEQLKTIPHRPMLVCENARNLEHLPALDLDAVITSPPYLNGTNYFRNTKIELWFLRSLRTGEDLAGFRNKAITAGINDVTVAKLNGSVDTAVSDIVTRLEIAAYDSRIPRMIASYFADMRAVFNGIKKHLKDKAIIAVDIGDSQYSGIHVPTDKLLADILQAQGFVLEREITLRKRVSRSGLPLRQVLLVFRLDTLSRDAVHEQQLSLFPSWAEGWARFKERLPHQQGDFAKRNWGHPLHSLCSYQGKMKPSLAAYLVKTFAPTGGTILDPFAGVGTIPFEAALQGVRSWAFDISPTALHISAAKLDRPDGVACEQLLDSLAESLQREQVTDLERTAALAIHFNGPLPDYFAQETFREILLARRYFLQHPPVTASESLILAALLHILHGNRPYALSRRSHPITPFAPTGEFEYRPLMSRLREKVERSLAVTYPQEFTPGKAIFQDATSWWPQQVDHLDAIITSPPFFDSTRFYLANWMRLWFCGWEAADFRIRPLAFVDERQKTSFEIYEPIFRQGRERLKSNGVMVLHLGKSRKCDMAQALARVANRWFSVADVFSENVEHCESHGIRDKGTVEEHQYLVLH
jgi:tRNA G10  N-methylase Trm11